MLCSCESDHDEPKELVLDQIVEGDFTTKLEYNGDRSIKRHWIGHQGNFNSYLNYEYNGGMNVSRTYYVIQSGTPVVSNRRSMIYNSSGELTEMVLSINDAWYIKWHFAYANDRISKMTTWIRDNPDSVIYDLGYDSRGNVSTVVLNDFNRDTHELIFQQEQRMEYDEKLNPFHALISPHDIYKLGPNNMIKQANFHHASDGSIHEEGTEITYDYNDEGFPVRSFMTYYGGTGADTEVFYSYTWK